MITAPKKMRESGVFKEIWRAHNNLLDFCCSIAVQQSGSMGVKVTPTSNGTLLKVDKPRVETTSEVTMFKLKSISADYTICRTWDGETEGDTDVKIAKPFEVRATGWDGQTINHTLETSGIVRSVRYAYISHVHRSATSGTTVEIQAVRPQYLPEITIIHAARSTNGTGVTDADEWIEQSCRAFAKIA